MTLVFIVIATGTAVLGLWGLILIDAHVVPLTLLSTLHALVDLYSGNRPEWQGEGVSLPLPYQVAEVTVAEPTTPTASAPPPSAPPPISPSPSPDAALAIELHCLTRLPVGSAPQQLVPNAVEVSAQGVCLAKGFTDLGWSPDGDTVVWRTSIDGRSCRPIQTDGPVDLRFVKHG
ncbi:hypothetical protein [uncultured Friedmanniella sp.]|uniref:hypothetical protein n=1 Tax=uncultured Friedmanniella sp. TaxID=335381 RepID=UPI0035CAF01B